MRFLWLLLIFPTLAQAEIRYGFADVSFNHLNWDLGTENKSSKRDFQFAELEGFAQFDWGDIYGFFDYENPGYRGSEVRTASKGALYRYLGLGGLSFYAHIYNFAAHGFFEQNRVIGLGYDLHGEGWWFKPFLAFNEVSQSFFSGPNGYMVGWTAGYNFTVLTRKFMVANWHELEFERKSAYSASMGDNPVSHNGAVSVWWHALEKMSVGIQGRYAVSKLGTPGSSNALIYTVKLFL